MALFDGETFRGLDEALTAPDEPLDTLLEHEVRNQMFHLARQRGNRVCHNLSTRAPASTAFEGEKAYASSTWTTILDVPWYASAGLETITAQLWARVSSSGAGFATSSITVRLEVVGYAWTDHELPYDGGIYRAYELSHTLSLRPTTPRLTRLRIWIWSRADDATVLTPDVEAFVTPLGDGRPSRRVLLVTDPDYMPAPTLPAPNATSRGEARMVWRESAESPDNVADILWRERSAFFPLFREIHAAEPPVSASRNAIWYYQQLSYIQVKGIQIEETFEAPTILTSRSLRAQMPVTGQDAVRHVALANAIFRRPRCLASGPANKVDRDAEAPAIYPERWVWSHDVEPAPPDPITPEYAAGEGAEQRVWTTSVTLDDPGGALILHASLIPYILMITPDWQAVEGQPLEDVRTLATWRINANLMWWDGSAWEVFGVATIDTQITHIPTRINEPLPVLTTAWAREQLALTSEAVAYKEGQLYRQDLAIVVPLSLGMEIPDDLELTGIPLTLVLTAQRLTIDDQPVGVAASGRPQLIWTGHTAWQVRS